MKNNSLVSIVMLILIGALLYVGINFNSIIDNKEPVNTTNNEVPIEDSPPKEPETPTPPSSPTPTPTPPPPSTPSTPATPSAPSVTQYTLTYNANGGIVSPTTKKINKGSKIGTLPTPTRSGYTFNGWYTEATGGSKVNENTTINSNITIYAQWKKDEVKISEYPTSITLSSTSGTLYTTGKVTLKATISPANAKNQEITWSSSNTSVATVSKTGVVTGKKEGTSTITAKTSNGKTATYKLTVVKAKIALIGNSKTYRSSKYPSVHAYFMNMLKNRGYEVNLTVIQKGGSKLIFKATNSPYKEEIQKYYDIAILQEKTATSAEGLNEYDSGVNNTISLLKSKNSKIKIYLRESFQALERDENNVVLKFKTEQPKANANALALTKKYNITLIKDGSSFIEYGKAKKLKDLFVTDKNHGSDKGVYLVAACMYKRVTTNNPEKITYYGTIDKKEAKELLNIANKIC